MRPRGIEYETSSNTIRSDFHLLAGKLCNFPFRDAHGYLRQDSFSFSINNFHSLSHYNSNSSFNPHHNSH